MGPKGEHRYAAISAICSASEPRSKAFSSWDQHRAARTGLLGAARAGLSNDYQVEEAIAGLSDPQEIRAALIELAGYDFARDYMLYFKMDWTW